MSGACAAHDLANVLEVEVDKTRCVNQVGDALYAVLEDVVCLCKGVEKGNLGFRNQTQTLVLDNDQGIHIFLEGCDAALCLFHSLFALKFKRLGHDTDRQDVHFLCHLCHNRSRSGAGAAAHAGCNENHLTAFDCSCNLIAAFFRCLLTSLGNASCSASSGQTVANDDLLAGFRVL